MSAQPAANIPLTDVYVCGVMDDPTAPPGYDGYSTLIEIDGDRVGIRYDRYPRLPFRTFFLEDCA